MPGSLVIEYSFAGERRGPVLLETVFSHPFFTPVAAGGMAGQRKRHHWLFAGRALEDFGLTSFWRAAETGSVHYVEPESWAERDYLLHIAQWARKRRFPDDLLSPFEVAHHEVGATFLKEPFALRATVLDEYARWSASYKRWNFELYGAVKLAVRDRGRLPWDRALRHIEPSHAKSGGFSYGPPFLNIYELGESSEVQEGQPHTSLTIYSGSFVWLAQAKDLGGLVGPDEADENLAGLVSLARSLAEDSGERLDSILVRFDGSIFRDEQDRLRRAFAGLAEVHDGW